MRLRAPTATPLSSTAPDDLESSSNQLPSCVFGGETRIKGSHERSWTEKRLTGDEMLRQEVQAEDISWVESLQRLQEQSWNVGTNMICAFFDTSQHPERSEAISFKSARQARLRHMTTFWFYCQPSWILVLLVSYNSTQSPFQTGKLNVFHHSTKMNSPNCWNKLNVCMQILSLDIICL